MVLLHAFSTKAKQNYNDLKEFSVQVNFYCFIYIFLHLKKLKLKMEIMNNCSHTFENTMFKDLRKYYKCNSCLDSNKV